MFYLVSVGYDGSEHPLAIYGTFETGQLASARAKDLMQLGDFRKVSPRRVATTIDWMARETRRDEHHTHFGTIEMPDEWDLASPYPHHCLRGSENSGFISYFPEDIDGILDRRTEQKVTRYLAKFFPTMGDLEVKRYAAMMADSELLFAHTADEFEAVYTNGPESCMSHRRGHWPVPEHPVRVYAAGDLAVAYLRNRDGRISGRAICWPEKKVHGRVYGDEARMLHALVDAGYTKVETMDGARMRKVGVKVDDGRDECGQILIPFFDNFAGVIVDGDHLVSISRETARSGATAYYSGSQRGYTKPVRYCPRYEAHLDPATFEFVEGPDGGFWSAEAISEYAGRCVADGLLHPRGELVKVGPNTFMLKTTAEARGYARDDYRLILWLPAANMVTTSDGARVAPDNLSRYESRLIDRAERAARQKASDDRRRERFRAEEEDFRRRQDFLAGREIDDIRSIGNRDAVVYASLHNNLAAQFPDMEYTRYHRQDDIHARRTLLHDEYISVDPIARISHPIPRSIFDPYPGLNINLNEFQLPVVDGSADPVSLVFADVAPPTPAEDF